MVTVGTSTHGTSPLCSWHAGIHTTLCMEFRQPQRHVKICRFGFYVYLTLYLHHYERLLLFVMLE